VPDVFWCVLCVWAKLPEIKLDDDDDDVAKIGDVRNTTVTPNLIKTNSQGAFAT